jgi:DNA helicase-2/ATP-dependent DNA helicase PcrA
LLQELLATWPDTVVLDLTRNHRSTAHIVSVADTLLEAGAAGITPAKADGEIPLVRAYDTDELEARAVTTWLNSRHQPGSPWRSMAVLARTNNQLNIIGETLATMHIPFERRGAENSPGSDVIVGDTGPARWFDQEHKDAVSLSTIHRSKGLEWQHVAVIGLAEGVLPNFNATSADDIAEEQRLAYVALTRAEESLLLTWNRGRQDPRTPDRQPSRFLAAIEQKISELAAVEAPLLGDERRRRLAAIREQLAASRPPLSSDGSERPPS